MDCTLRSVSKGDDRSNVLPLDQFPIYWYTTGPRVIFDEYIRFDHVNDAGTVAAAEGFSFLVKWEDNGQNLWHTMMEIMSLTMSLDVLRITPDSSTGQPFFTNADTRESRIVFLDDLPTTPYDDLWTMYSELPSARLEDLKSKTVVPTKVVLPLPGSSNPLWQADWVDLDCGESALLKTFSKRVLDYHRIANGWFDARRQLTITLIDRKQTRRLLNMTDYFATLHTKFPNAKIRLIDFAAISLREQLQISHSTDILVGVHGAGLTHGIFLPPNSTIVEIQPPTLEHKGFKNMAQFLGHRYLGAHGTSHESIVGDDWHFQDVYLEQSQFIGLLEDAVVSTIR